MLEETLAGQRLWEWLDAFKTGNVYVMRGFIKERYAQSTLEHTSPDDLALADIRLYQDTGALNVSRIEHFTDNEITVLAQAARTQKEMRIRVQIEEAAPRSVITIAVQPVPAR